MYYSNAPEAIWFLFRRSVQSDKVCTANMFTYHSTSLIPHITDIEKNNRNHSLIFWQGTSSQHWQELKSTGVWGVKQVLLLVEPWDLSKSELYIEEYSTSERIIITWEPPCMNLERNIVWGGESWTVSHLKTTWICSNPREKRSTSEEMILYILHLRTTSRLRIISHLRSILWYLRYNPSLHALTLLECISVL